MKIMHRELNFNKKTMPLPRLTKAYKGKLIINMFQISSRVGLWRTKSLKKGSLMIFCYYLSESKP